MSLFRTRPVTATTTLLVTCAALLGAPALLRAQAAGNDYTPADVTFMQGMIVHHAQAVVMSNWAPTH
ncbi:MAG: hypothetical protein ACRENQ_03320, partial [Gemmatimonadaceae bacterium]